MATKEKQDVETPQDGADARVADAAAPGSTDVSTPVQTEAEARLDAVVSQWLVDNLHSSPLSRNSECWETLVGALPALKAMILKED